jgi:hypothetical protein
MSVNVTVIEEVQDINIEISKQEVEVNISIDQFASERAVQASIEAIEARDNALISEQNALTSEQNAFTSEQEANQSKLDAESARDTAIEAKDEVLPLIPIAEQIAELNLLLSTYTVELIDALVVDFYAPFAIKINSVNPIVANPTITIKVNDVAYTLGNTIEQGAKVNIESNIESVINLNIEYVI